ncbi:MAG: XdhC family protein [Proteobacteria bacterium]|nr:XdhC family protein [Pseudomonadota bacterium]
MLFYEYLSSLEAKSEPFAIVTVIKASENSPGRTAFKMCVTTDGQIVGSVGGGSLEYGAKNEALEMLRTGERTRVVKYFLKDKEDGGNGMACGGEAELLIETVMPRPHLYIFGGGHIGSTLTRYAADVGFDVTVIDDRPAFASAEAHPQASACRLIDSYDDVERLTFVKDAYFVIVTHQHVGDGATLRGLLRHDDLDAKYIGMIGSAKKLARVFRDMMAADIPEEKLRFVHAPIGIDHGGQSANEIAISIAAELIAARNGRELADSCAAKKHPLNQPIA